MGVHRLLIEGHWCMLGVGGGGVMSNHFRVCVPDSGFDLDHRKSTLARGSMWDYTPLPF